MNKVKTLFFLILLGTTLPVLSQITIDGVLDEQEWQTAQVIEEFVEVSPFTLETAPLKTKALVYSCLLYTSPSPRDRG